MSEYRELNSAEQQKPSVFIEFFLQTEKDDAATATAGHAVFKDVEWARWYKKGSNGQSTECPVARLPKYYPIIWNAFKPAYDAWKAGQEPPLNGTPLAEWPAASRAEVETLRAINIRTVEDLAEITDGDGPRIGMGWRKLRDAARAFMATAKDRGVLAAQMADKDKQINELTKQVASLLDDVAQMRTTLDRLQPRVQPPGRKKDS